MKTTIDHPDDLLVEAKKRAAEERTTLRVLFERSLRSLLARRTARPPRRSSRPIRRISVRGGLPPDLDIGDRSAMHDWLRRKG